MPCLWERSRQRCRLCFPFVAERANVVIMQVPASSSVQRRPLVRLQPALALLRERADLAQAAVEEHVQPETLVALSTTYLLGLLSCCWWWCCTMCRWTVGKAVALLAGILLTSANSARCREAHCPDTTSLASFLPAFCKLSDFQSLKPTVTLVRRCLHDDVERRDERDDVRAAPHTDDSGGQGQRHSVQRSQRRDKQTEVRARHGWLSWGGSEGIQL